MKPVTLDMNNYKEQVAPYVGAWIETTTSKGM